MTASWLSGVEAAYKKTPNTIGIRGLSILLSD